MVSSVDYCSVWNKYRIFYKRFVFKSSNRLYLFLSRRREWCVYTEKNECKSIRSEICAVSKTWGRQRLTFILHSGESTLTKFSECVFNMNSEYCHFQETNVCLCKVFVLKAQSFGIMTISVSAFLVCKRQLADVFPLSHLMLLFYIRIPCSFSVVREQ